jgi:hypothetical protein
LDSRFDVLTTQPSRCHISLPLSRWRRASTHAHTHTRTHAYIHTHTHTHTTTNVYFCDQIMGNPMFAGGKDDTGVFTSWKDAGQLKSWETMVGAIASRYVTKYGIDTVARWR